MNYATESEIYLFCIYFSLNNFNYPNKKLAIPSKLRNSSAEFPQHSREKKIAWVLGAGSNSITFEHLTDFCIVKLGLCSELSFIFVCFWQNYLKNLEKKNRAVTRKRSVGDINDKVGNKTKISYLHRRGISCLCLSPLFHLLCDQTIFINND